MERIKKCPFCAEVIKAEAVVCKHCGRDVGGSPQPVAKTKPENNAAAFGLLPLILIFVGCPAAMLVTGEWYYGAALALAGILVLVYGMATGEIKIFG
jgi:hypothetical protein